MTIALIAWIKKVWRSVLEVWNFFAVSPRLRLIPVKTVTNPRQPRNINKI